jgi:hypothetical protein
MKKLMLLILCVFAFVVTSCDDNDSVLTGNLKSSGLEDISTVMITPTGKILSQSTRSVGSSSERALGFKIE